MEYLTELGWVPVKCATASYVAAPKHRRPCATDSPTLAGPAFRHWPFQHRGIELG